MMGGNETGTAPDFNEYVWIPMTDMSKFTRMAWNGPYWNGSWQNGVHPLADGSEINKYWEETDSEEYTNMFNSVNLNKGFYISRYEASKNNNTTAQSKRNQNPWIDVSRLDAITASSNMNTSINSHLIYGIEWDSILTWLLNSNTVIGNETGNTKTITIDDIQKDSRSWGNYSNSVGGAATNAGNSAKPSGINEYWKANNIYDLAGNVWEWTQENYSTGTYRAYRAGSFYDIGGNSPVIFRNSHHPESYSSDNLRF